MKQVQEIDGKKHISTVHQYFEQIQTVIHTFDKNIVNWTTNPFRTFMDNLDLDIKNRVAANGFKLRTTNVSTRPQDQIDLIQQGYEAATLAELQLEQQRSFIHQQMSNAHGFLSQVIQASQPIN